jgi:DTW domain-containing protein YfiP
VNCPVPVIVIQHWKELRKPTSTGSLLATLLSQGPTRLHGHREIPFDPSGLDQPDTWLVFPDRNAPPVIPTTLPRQIVLLDGNWNQASRMARRIRQIAELPRLSLTAPARSVRRLRLPPDPAAISTMEAAAAALRLIGHPDTASELEYLHDRYVAATLRQRGQDVPDPPAPGHGAAAAPAKA